MLQINHPIYEVKESYAQRNLLNKASCFNKRANFKLLLISALNSLKWRPFRTLELLLQRMHKTCAADRVYSRSLFDSKDFQ